MVQSGKIRKKLHPNFYTIGGGWLDRQRMVSPETITVSYVPKTNNTFNTFMLVPSALHNTEDQIGLTIFIRLFDIGTVNSRSFPENIGMDRTDTIKKLSLQFATPYTGGRKI